MEKVNYEPSEILISLREPFNKNTIWIYPNKEEIEFRIFDKGWRTIYTTEDKGLSELSSKLLKDSIEELRTNLIQIIKKLFGKFNSNANLLLNRLKELEERIVLLEDKFIKLNRKFNGKAILRK